MKKLLDLIRQLLEIVCCVVLSTMSVIVLMQVIDRNLFDKTFVWVEELAGLCMVAITFLGAALATCTNQHTRIDFLVLKLPKRGSLIVYILGNIVCCVFVFMLARYAIPLISKNWTSLTPRLKLPYGINYLSVAIGSVLMLVYLITQIVEYAKEFMATPPGTKNHADESMEREAKEALNQ